MDLPYLDMLCNLVYVKNVTTTGFFTVSFDFQSLTMDLFDTYLWLGFSGKQSVRDNLTVLNVHIFRIFTDRQKPNFIGSRHRESIDYTKIASIIRKPRNLRSPQPSSFIWGQVKVNIPFVPVITEKLPVSQLDGLSDVYITCRRMECRKNVKRCRLFT